MAGGQIEPSASRSTSPSAAYSVSLRRRSRLFSANFLIRCAGLVARGELAADVTPHVLRHSFASLAADLGYSEPTIAALVGHKGRSITSRYVHSADAVLLAAADTVACRTAELMGDAADEAAQEAAT
jgi:integrase